jgi:GT2 family glycosyltransferase
VSYEIIVVDNASTDGSADFITKNFPEVKLIVSKKNLGFAAGNNLGIKAATGDIVMLLNSDTQIIGDCLDICLKYLKKRDRIGVLSPKVVLSDKRLDPACHRGFPTVWNSFCYFVGLEKLFPHQKIFAGYHQLYKDFDKPHWVDAVSGAAMFIRRQVIDEIGLLDEQFFMYAEDLDFCFRAKKAGWQIYFLPKAQVVHFKGSSGTRHKDQNLQSQTKRYFYDTMKQYFDKHYGKKYPKIIRLLVHKGVDVIAKLRH